MKKAILFAALSVLGTGVAMAAPAPAVQGPETVQSAINQAYALGQKLGSEFGESQNWSNNGMKNGINEINVLHSEAVANIDADMQKLGYDNGMSMYGNMNLQTAMWNSFNAGVNSVIHKVTPFAS